LRNVNLKFPGAMIAILVLFSVTVSANSSYFSSVQQICSAYQIQLDYNRMNLRTMDNGNMELIMNLESARNQFDRVMLIGFYAAGKAMAYHKEPIQKVTIVIGVAYKGVENIVANADRDTILKFVNGEITSSEFVRKVKFD
jgi:hypothetical protein